MARTRRPAPPTRRVRNRELALLTLAVVLVLLAYLTLGLAVVETIPDDLPFYAAALAGLALVAHACVRRYAPSADPLLLPLAFLLNGLGVVMVRSIDFSMQAARGSEVEFAPQQALWTLVAVVAFCVLLVGLRDHRVLDTYRYLIGVGAIALLFLPSLPVLGQEVNGARIWLNLGAFSFQPGELAKIGLSVFFASYLADKRQLLQTATSRLGPLRIPPLRAFGPVLLVWAASVLVLVNQRDLGLSLLLFGMFVVLIYVATARVVYLIGGFGLFAVGAAVAYQAFDHFRQRVEIWQDPFADPAGAGFQLVQSLFAMADGGLFGVGWGGGRPDMIPFSRTDFIFAAFAEELGLLGVSAILLCYFLIAGRTFAIAVRCRDDFGTLLAACLAIVFTLQVFVIVGGVTGLIPLSGMTLPFASYGGSALVSNYLLVALVLRVSAAPAPARTARPAEEVAA